MSELPLIDLLAQGVKVTQEARFSAIAATALQYYDWLLLLDQEVELIHSRKWTSIRVLYVLTRYYPLLIWPFELYVNISGHSVETCRKLMRPAYILQFPLQCFAQFVMVYRAYAFTGYKTTILILLGSCYLALVGGELWAFLTPPVAVPDIFFKLIGNTGCFPNYNDSLMQPRVVVGSISPVLGLTSTCPNQFIMSAAMVMDLVSLLVVLFRVRRMTLGRNTVTNLFVQEGLWSFAGIVVVNTITAIEYFASDPHNGSGIPFLFLMSNMFACRTILHLRNVGKRRSQVSSETSNPVVRAAIALADENAGRTSQDDWENYAHAKQQCLA